MTVAETGPLIVVHPADRIVLIPPGIHDFRKFRAWTISPSFPECGRIDWVGDRLEIDMSPEDLNTHGSPKSAIAGELISVVQKPGRGVVFIDRTRYVHETAELSAEPDVLVLFVETIESGRARLVPRASREPSGFVEIQGAVDLVVECVSDSSRDKDEKRLALAYFESGVREYWLVDARGPSLRFDVLRRGPEGWEPAEVDDEGFRDSGVLERRVRLDRTHEAAGLVFFRLDVE